MFGLDPFYILLVMAFSLFVIGLSTLITGIIILAVRSSGNEVKTMAKQTARLAHKGMAEDVAGLVGNASDLLGAMNDLVRTTAGVGVFLSILGIVLMAIAGWIGLQIFSLGL